MPAGVLQQTSDDPISVAAILAGKDDDVLGQLLLIGAWIVGGLALARSTFRFNEA